MAACAVDAQPNRNSISHKLCRNSFIAVVATQRAPLPGSQLKKAIMMNCFAISLSLEKTFGNQPISTILCPAASNSSASAKVSLNTICNCQSVTLPQATHINYGGGP